MQGKGIYKWRDGRTYEGEYYNDKKHVYKMIYCYRDLVHMYGLMGEGMKGSGKMANSTDKANIFYKMETQELDCGRMVKELNGLIMKLKIDFIT